MLRSESPSGKCAKLHTVAASNNRDHPTRSLWWLPSGSAINCSPGSQALLKVTNQDHSIGITLLLLVRAPYIWVIFFAHIPFVVNRTFNERQPRGCNNRCAILIHRKAKKAESSWMITWQLAAKLELSTLVFTHERQLHRHIGSLHNLLWSNWKLSKGYFKGRMTGAFAWPSSLRHFFKCLPNLLLRELPELDVFGTSWVRLFQGAATSLLPRMTKNPAFCSWTPRGSPQAWSASEQLAYKNKALVIRM